MLFEEGCNLHCGNRAAAAEAVALNQMFHARNIVLRVNFDALLQSKDNIQRCKPNFWDSYVKLAQGFEAAAAVDPAGIESDDLEKREAGRASSARGVGNGRGQGRGLLGSSRTKSTPFPSSGRHWGNRATRSAA